MQLSRPMAQQVARRPRVFYCGMVNTREYSQRIGTPLFVGAGSNKMTSIVRAMRAAGSRAWLVSMPVLGRGAAKRYSSWELVPDVYRPSLFLPTTANRWCRKIVALTTFGWFCATRVRMGDKIVLYNHALEYLLGLLVLKVRGVQVFLDIEDAPREDEHGPLAMMLRHIFPLTFQMTDARKITVSESLAKRLAIRDYCAVYGATTIDHSSRAVACKENWGAVERGGPLRIHFGGSLSEDTGVSIFCDAVRMLATSPLPGAGCVVFYVTGSGGDEQLSALQGVCTDPRLQVIWRKDLPREQYLAEFLQCHAGLSLRVPGSCMSETTFPSKVVEITGNGLLLITTRVSDVPLLFDENNAVLLEHSTARELAERIKEIMNDPDGMRIRAMGGHRRAAEVFGELAVGKRLTAFLDIGAMEHIST